MPGYAMYLRKSRADIEAEAHGEGETLARHEHMLVELAQKMKLPITACYREVVSGESIDARPEVQKLLAEVEQGMYAGVFVVDVDRLARGDTVDQGIIARTFRLSGTKIITPKKEYDPTSEYDEEYFEFELFMARREYKIIARRIQRGRIASVKDGKFIGSTPPYGYDKIKIPNAKGYTLTPNAESDVVKIIYQMYIGGKGMSVIARELDEMHIIPRNRPTWSKSTVSDILSNPVYTGKIRWSYRPDIRQSVNGKIITKRMKNQNCYCVDGLHPAIVSPEDFEKAQQLKAENRRKPVKQNTSLQNPLTGLIYCEKCGEKMTRLGPNSRNKYDTIKCTNRYCDCVSAPMQLVEGLLIESLSAHLNHYDVMLAGNKKSPASENQRVKEQAITEIYAEIAKIDEQINTTYDLLEQKVYTIDVFTERNKMLADKKEKLLNDATKLKQSLIELRSNEKMRNDFIPQLRHVIESYSECKTAEEKNNLLKCVVDRIIYYKDTPNKKGHGSEINFSLRLILKVPDNL